MNDFSITLFFVVVSTYGLVLGFFVEFTRVLLIHAQRLYLRGREEEIGQATGTPAARA